MTNANVDEAQRQATILAYQLGDRGTDPFFDDVTRLASDLFAVPIAVVTVLAEDAQLFRGACKVFFSTICPGSFSVTANTSSTHGSSAAAFAARA